MLKQITKYRRGIPKRLASVASCYVTTPLFDSSLAARVTATAQMALYASLTGMREGKLIAISSPGTADDVTCRFLDEASLELPIWPPSPRERYKARHSALRKAVAELREVCQFKPTLDAYGIAFTEAGGATGWPEWCAGVVVCKYPYVYDCLATRADLRSSGWPGYHSWLKAELIARRGWRKV